MKHRLPIVTGLNRSPTLPGQLPGVPDDGDVDSAGSDQVRVKRLLNNDPLSPLVDPPTDTPAFKRLLAPGRIERYGALGA